MRIPVRLLVVLGLLLILPLTGCNKLRARDELNKGVRAYKNASYEEAVDHFRRAIELDPSLINARLYLATAYASQFTPGSPTEENRKNADAAIEAFGQVLERDPNNVTALSYTASIYYGMAGGAETGGEIPIL
jgi:tetratricopeptide (TPR) repeat protein